MTDLDYGILSELMQDEQIESILVNDPKHIFVLHRWDGYQLAKLAFEDADALRNFAVSLAKSAGQSLDTSHPMLELRLADGSRATLIIAPVATQGAVIRISKHLHDKFDMSKLLEVGAISPAAAQFLSAAVMSRLNIAVVGGFDSGKIQFLNALINEIPEDARLLAIQPIATLSIEHADAVILESPKNDSNGAKVIQNRQLLEQAPQLMPHRLILAEVDGTEVDLLLRTMDLGYSTIFGMSAANVPDAISRLVSLASSANLSTPLLSFREQVARTLNLIVHVELFKSGDIALKRVMGIWEVRGMKGDNVEIVPLFERSHDRDELMPLGESPMVLAKMREMSRSEIDESWFRS